MYYIVTISRKKSLRFEKDISDLLSEFKKCIYYTRNEFIHIYIVGILMSSMMRQPKHDMMRQLKHFNPQQCQHSGPHL